MYKRPRLKTFKNDKPCSMCGVAGLESYKRSRKCVTCKNLAAKFIYNTSKPTREYTRNSNLKSRFGINMSEYNRMLGVQNGLCKICGMINDGKSLCVDHCHKTGKIRGLLCANCNSGIGMMKDSPDILRNAIDYLVNNELK